MSQESRLGKSNLLANEDELQAMKEQLNEMKEHYDQQLEQMQDKIEMLLTRDCEQFKGKDHISQTRKGRGRSIKLKRLDVHSSISNGKEPSQSNDQNERECHVIDVSLGKT